MSNDFQTIYLTSGQTYFNRAYAVPKKCPHCSVVIAPAQMEYQKTSYDDTRDLNFLLHKCTYCNKNYLTTHLRSKKSAENQFISIYPELAGEEIPKIIEDFSPKFAKIYKQASASERLNHIEIAATGYRMALEILVKDFATSDHPDQEDKIKKSSLNNCLKDYFSDVPLSVTGHVVRILGNDYVHYIQKHPDVEFNEIKYFMNIFLLSLEMKLKIKNPPVAVPAVQD